MKYFFPNLILQSWPSIEKYKFRLGSVVSGLASLRKLSTKILEPSLTDQILGAFGPKLKEIEITGKELQSITLDAFEGRMSLILSDTGSVLFVCHDSLSYSLYHYRNRKSRVAAYNKGDEYKGAADGILRNV